jgi:hypothetical protein
MGIYLKSHVHFARGYAKEQRAGLVLLHHCHYIYYLHLNCCIGFCRALLKSTVVAHVQRRYSPTEAGITALCSYSMLNFTPGSWKYEHEARRAACVASGRGNGGGSGSMPYQIQRYLLYGTSV